MEINNEQIRVRNTIFETMLLDPLLFIFLLFRQKDKKKVEDFLKVNLDSVT